MSWFDKPTALLPELIALNGQWQAEKAAVLQGERRLTWKEFDGSTNRIANGLAGLGMGAGARIAVLMSNSIEMVELLFGSGKASVSAVPLNVSVSDAAIAGMIIDSGAGAVAASDDHCARIDALVAAGRLPSTLQLIGIDAPGGRWRDLRVFRDAQSSQRPAVAVKPETECNIIYSSGTTAVPKGIVHSHLCRMYWANDLALALRYHSGAVTLCSLGLFSNISWVAMLATILVGGTIVVMREFSPRALFEHIERYRVTHGTFVPVQFQRMLEARDLPAHDLSSLETIMCCGSPMTPALKRATRDRLGCNLIELYGLTEGIVTTLAPEDFDRKIESVGRPIPGQQIAIVGSDDREVARGVDGEIVGLGPLAMEGYHNRPDATAEATWVDASGRRWMRTGDIGRLDDEGFLYIVDRKKDMILSGGQNIYPADIEAVMLQHPSVTEVAVIGVPDPTWVRRRLLSSCSGRRRRRPKSNSCNGLIHESASNSASAVLFCGVAPAQSEWQGTEARPAHRIRMTHAYREFTYLSNDGLSLFCREYGSLASAGTVVCLPGLTRNSRDFTPLAHYLARRYRVLTPDLRGRGFSQWDPQWSNYQPAVYYQDVLKLMTDEAREPVAIIGTSLGGILAMALGATAPDRVAGIVLNDVGPEVAAAGIARIGKYAGLRASPGNWSEAAAQVKANYGLAYPDFEDADWLEYAKASYRENAEGKVVADYDPKIGDALRAASGPPADLWATWAALAS